MKTYNVTSKITGKKVIVEAANENMAVNMAAMKMFGANKVSNSMLKSYAVEEV